MKMVVEFELTIEGDITEKKAKEIFLGEHGLGKFPTILSEDVDGSEDYMIGIDIWREKK